MQDSIVIYRDKGPIKTSYFVDNIILLFDSINVQYSDSILLKQIYFIIYYHIWIFLTNKSESILHDDDIKSLTKMLKVEDDFLLQIYYFNWLFLKAVNQPAKEILPQNKELRTLNASMFSGVGMYVYNKLLEINSLLENNTLSQIQIQDFCFMHFIHLIPESWNLCPSQNGMVGVACYLEIKESIKSKYNY
jgi:hypothetical protein